MEQDTDSRSMAFCFGISLVIHLIFIGSLILMPEPAPRPRLGLGAINVSLVSIPGPPAGAPAEEKIAAPATEPAAEPVVIPKKEAEKVPQAPVIDMPSPKPLPVVPAPSKTVSLAPKESEPKLKKSLKKKTIDRQKMIDQALTRVEKKVEASRSDSVQQAIDRLKKKVAQTEAVASKSGAASGGASDAVGAGVPGGTGAGVPGGTGAGGKRALEITDLYKIEVAFRVERHWAFSQQLAGDDRALQASLVFKVLPSGEITDIRFTQHSGNSYLDDSAFKAIVKANPVSPHPEGLGLPYVTVALRFTPEGLRK
ncbi:MAG: TonB family protein [Desulfobacterales bacterium]|nr:MAG: TonB family protein [Desulfobacterales bacterium]